MIREQQCITKRRFVRSYDNRAIWYIRITNSQKRQH